MGSQPTSGSATPTAPPLTQELQSQLDALAAHGIHRENIFAEKISTRVKVRPQFEAALTLARQIKAHAPHCRVILTVYEMKRLGRDAAEPLASIYRALARGDPGLPRSRPGGARRLRSPARRRHPPAPPGPHPTPGPGADSGGGRTAAPPARLSSPERGTPIAQQKTPGQED
ncbi:recombinase family protein [Nonomuraea sp. ATR24]|uniref:recombinase family protein n=1 Tax=Nonomuraea sp. ATR24 TaxID=1676744 RepID=UPI0035C0DC7D